MRLPDSDEDDDAIAEAAAQLVRDGAARAVAEGLEADPRSPPGLERSSHSNSGHAEPPRPSTSPHMAQAAALGAAGEGGWAAPRQRRGRGGRPVGESAEVVPWGGEGGEAGAGPSRGPLGEAVDGHEQVRPFNTISSSSATPPARKSSHKGGKSAWTEEGPAGSMGATAGTRLAPTRSMSNDSASGKMRRGSGNVSVHAAHLLASQLCEGGTRGCSCP